MDRAKDGVDISNAMAIIGQRGNVRSMLSISVSKYEKLKLCAEEPNYIQQIFESMQRLCASCGFHRKNVSILAQMHDFV